MKAILLAGGFGTRLYPLTLRTPKPMLPVAGKPILQYTIELLVSAKIRDITISLKINQKKIEKYFGDGSRFGAKLSYLYEPEVTEDSKLGSVGAISYVLSKIKIQGSVLVIGGDNFIAGLDISKFAKSHEELSANASIALFELSTIFDAQHFGVAKINESGRIIGFQEKPSPDKAISKLASTAVYALDHSFIKEHLQAYTDMKRKKGEKADHIGDLWAHFVNDLHFVGHPFEGIWGDIGNIDGYLETNRKAFDLASKEVASGYISPNAKIAKTAQIIPPIVIEDNCIIGEGAKIGPYVHLMHGCEVGKNTRISNSIIFEHCGIGQNVAIENSVLDGNVNLGPSSTISEYSSIGFGVKVGALSTLTSIKIYPGISIQEKSSLKGELKNTTSPTDHEMVKSCYWL